MVTLYILTEGPETETSWEVSYDADDSDDDKNYNDN